MKFDRVNDQKPIDISKALEIINFKVLREEPAESYLKQDFKSWIVNEKNIVKKYDLNEYNLKSKEIRNNKDEEKTQFRSFQKAMKILLLFGQFFGINPVSMITEKDISKIRFVVKSWHCLYSVLVAIIEFVITALCFKLLLSNPVSIRSLAYISFNFSICCTSLIFIRIATKWSMLVKEIFNCNLDEYVDQNIIRKIKIICIVTLCLALVEHILAVLARTIQIYECETYEHGLYERFIRQTFPWLFDTGASYCMPLGILLQVRTIIATVYWNYSDVFIVCMSLFLASMLNQINKKINWAADTNYLSPSVWATLREDYTRATRLIRQFDFVFSSLILVSLASNLFFMSLQLFNILANGVLPRQFFAEKCHNYPSGPLRGYEYPVYLVYSLAFLFMRFLTVALVAASVNVAAMEPASALYRVPSYAFCDEVQRFLDQVHGDFIALSGLDFFYITRDLVLTVAGTIVTYQLVLLQFNSDDLNQA